MGRVIEIIENDFNMDSYELLDGIMQSDFFDGYFGSMSDGKRQEMIELLQKHSSRKRLRPPLSDNLPREFDTLQS